MLSRSLLRVLVAGGCLSVAGWLGCSRLVDVPEASGAGGSGADASQGGSGGGGSETGGGSSDGGGGTSLALGETCTDAEVCSSGFCVDGVCCDAACDGVCVACVEGLTGSPNGTCTAALADTDPDDECDEGGDVCGPNGLCNGDSGAPGCAFFSGTTCAAATCVGNSYDPGGVCNGMGTCSGATPTDCFPYSCDDDRGCLTSCGLGMACHPDAYCSFDTNACLPTKDDASPCDEDQECHSNHCVDGVCCDAACTGLCEACVKSHTGEDDGVCAFVSSNTDPDDECSGPSSNCNGNGQCVFL